jgi:glyceraldehyde-3-phosphate dehydrogenase (NADP+) (phosphorylating)
MSFTGLTSTALPTKAEQTFTGRVARQTATKATGAKTVAAMQGKVCKVAINGFGRIGRNFLRCWHGRENTMLDVVAINDSGGVKQASHLVKYDSVLGTFEADVKIVDDTHISIDGKKIEIVSNRDPLQLPWKALGVDIVIEGTGVFIDTPGASKHLQAGASKVVITAPAKGDDIPTYVLGVNADQYKHSDKIISNASCTTNGLAPFVKVLDEKFGIVKGLMTTTHSYTGDQRILDASHRDLRRARAAALNIVPTSTGAAKAVALVLPQLKGKLNGIALRVPTPNVSVVDLVVQTSKKVTADEVNATFREAANGKLKGILAVSDEPLVSIDFRCSDVSTTIDAALTMVMGDDMLKIVAWYDNEWGYSQRVVDLAELVAANYE